MEQNDKVLAKALPLGPVASNGGGERVSARTESTETKTEAKSPEPTDTSSPQPKMEAKVSPSEHAAESVQGEEPKQAESGKGPKRASNNVRKIRIERMMSKAELARRANLSVLTIDRVERGYGCRMDTKRKILEALGLSLADRVRVFGEEE